MKTYQVSEVYVNRFGTVDYVDDTWEDVRAFNAQAAADCVATKLRRLPECVDNIVIAVGDHGEVAQRAL